MTAVAAPAAVLDTPDLVGYPRFLRPRVAVPGVYFAGFWVRLGVNVIDGAVQAVLYLIVDYILGLISGAIGGIANLDSNAVTVWTSIVSALAVAVYYNLVLVARRGASPAMRIGALRIVKDADITTRAESRTLYIRGLIYLGFSLITPLRVLDALFIVFDERKRSLHDRLTGTVVVRRAPSPPQLASMLCVVCGRPVDEGTLCPKHGGTAGLTLTLSGHTVSLQVAASLLAAASLVAVIVGIVLAVSGHLIGIAAIVIGAVLLRVTMALTQLHTWARWVSTATGAVMAVVLAVVGFTQVSTSTTAAGFIWGGAAVGLAIVGCLWTPETHRAFQRIPG